jgi:protein arginine N-methyltransferase 1
MFAYHEAISKNAEAFKGKTVVDVGTGTGVLAVWSAKAGAARVLAVEFTGKGGRGRRDGGNDGKEEVGMGVNFATHATLWLGN